MTIVLVPLLIGPFVMSGSSGETPPPAPAPPLPPLVENKEVDAELSSEVDATTETKSEGEKVADPEPQNFGRKKAGCCKRFFCCIPKEESHLELAKYKNGGTDYYPSNTNNVASDVMDEGVVKEVEVEVTGEDGVVSVQVQKSEIKEERKPRKPRRTRVPDRPNASMSLWSILKNAIGKDLSRIAIPVNFSEPLSMLQRLAEDLEYTEILDAAARCEDASEQLCLVAAFTISSYATTAVRTAKPFNPMLGETYECDRMDDKGWRCVSEQVRHHPPTAAQHCEGQGWTLWQDFTMKSKFKGNYLEVIPLGIAHLTFKSSGNHYSWRKVTSYVHNLVIGRLWVDQEGEMDIINHTNGDKCTLKYIATSTFSREQKKVTGIVLNKAGVIKWVINGYWDKYIESTEVEDQKLTPDGKSDLTLKLITKYGTPKRLWTRRMQAPQASTYYNLTEFACQLNEPEEGVAPTDSRQRPDQRLMEEGKWEEANAEKFRLEEKQRSARKKGGTTSNSQSKTKVDDDEGHEPVWFKKQKDPISGLDIHIFQDTYWKHKETGDWSPCPNIF